MCSRRLDWGFVSLKEEMGGEEGGWTVEVYEELRGGGVADPVCACSVFEGDAVGLDAAFLAGYDVVVVCGGGDIAGFFVNGVKWKRERGNYCCCRALALRVRVRTAVSITYLYSPPESFRSLPLYTAVKSDVMTLPTMSLLS